MYMDFFFNFTPEKNVFQLQVLQNILNLVKVSIPEYFKNNPKTRHDKLVYLPPNSDNRTYFHTPTIDTQ